MIGLSVWFTALLKQQCLHLSITLELFQCISCCLQPNKPRWRDACRNCILRGRTGFLDAATPYFRPRGLWNIYWIGKFWAERWSFLQHAYKITNSSILGYMSFLIKRTWSERYALQVSFYSLQHNQKTWKYNFYCTSKSIWSKRQAEKILLYDNGDTYMIDDGAKV